MTALLHCEQDVVVGRQTGKVATYRMTAAGQLVRVRLVGVDGRPGECIEVPASRCKAMPCEEVSHG